jgi:hypothetical protein
LRLRNLTLGYTIPLKTKAVQSIRVYGMAENLFTISNYCGWDPEVDTKDMKMMRWLKIELEIIRVPMQG